MNSDFYGNGKTTCGLGEKKATQYAFAMRLRRWWCWWKNKIHEKNEEMKPVHIQCQNRKRKEICLLLFCYCPCSKFPLLSHVAQIKSHSVRNPIPNTLSPLQKK